MASTQVKLLSIQINKSCIKELMRSPQLVQCLESEAVKIESKANAMAKANGLASKHIPDYDHKAGVNNAGFANATVFTRSKMGKIDNSKNNTLLKSV